MSVSKTLQTRARAMLIIATVALGFGVAALAGSGGSWYPLHTFLALTVGTFALCAVVCYLLAGARRQVRPAPLPTPVRVARRRPAPRVPAARPRAPQRALTGVTHPEVSHPRPLPALTAHEQR